MKHRRFSRWMPPSPPRPPLRLWQRVLLYLILGIPLVIALNAYIRYPIALVIAAVVVPIVAFLTDKRLKTLAKGREGEDIGNFAHAFDRRSPSFDPWVVRAMWDALELHMTLPRKGDRKYRVAVRPTDDLVSGLGIDPEDLEGLVEEVAMRSGRSLESVERNPYYGRVNTVGDVVYFLFHQPRRPAA